MKRLVLLLLPLVGTLVAAAWSGDVKLETPGTMLILHAREGQDLRMAYYGRVSPPQQELRDAGAIKLGEGRYLLVCRVEGADRKSFFAVAESPNGIDNFRFWNEPVTMPEDLVPATNVYDMRLTQHEDGWIYGVFCAERHDDSQPGNLSAATATAATSPHERPRHVGTSARPQKPQSATQCRASSRIR